ncbi:MAG: hypothetical protein JWQ38_764 [Flavipsychrobacter sp.]|nr:hypothetical protein [Flavipsychrobacter sp.]
MTIPKKLYNYALVLFIITLLLRCVLITYYNNNMGGIETNVVYGIQRILLGQPLYQDPSSGTYAVIQYTPLYFFSSAGIAKVTGIHAPDVQSIYTLCRILTLVLNLLTILVAAAIIHTWSFTWRQSLIAATPILVILTTHYFLRGDSLHLLFFVSAVYAYILFSKQQQTKHLLLAALFSAACIMAKQSGVLVCGFIGLSLLMQRRFLNAVIYSAASLACAFIIAWLCTAGAWMPFYQNAYLGLKNGTDLSFLYNIFISQFFYELIPCYVLAGLVAYLAIRKIHDGTFRILSLGIVLAWLFAVITGLKIGSSNNYFVEFLTLLIIALPYLLQSDVAKQVLARPFGIAISTRSFAGFALFVVLTSKTMGLFTAVYIDRSIKNNKEQYLADKALYDYFIRNFHIRPGEHVLFTERNFLDNLFIDYSIMPTKDVVSETYLANAATFDYSAFTAGLNNGLVRYVVVDEKKKDFNRWYAELPFMKINEQKFKWVADKSGYSIYVYSTNGL